VAADTIILPKGSSLSDFASADVEQEQSRIIYGVGLVGPESVVGRPGDTVSLTLLVANLSPKSDSFSFDLSDAAGWRVKASPTRVQVNGLAVHEVIATVEIPETAEEGSRNLVTVLATSEADSSTTARTSTEVIVVESPSQGGRRLFLPLVSRR
jgi:hypothetical protein